MKEQIRNIYIVGSKPYCQVERRRALYAQLCTGRMPLAFSARCFTARHYKLPKDDCQLRCGDFSDGLLLDSQEGEQFLAVNGIQTQSATTCNLIGEIDEMKAMGIDVVRLSPHSRNMAEVAAAFRTVIDGSQTPQQVSPRCRARPAVRRAMASGTAPLEWPGGRSMSV